MNKTTIGDYLLTRLIELKVTDVFGVPGDYNLSFLDRIVNNKSLQWVGNCNELNAAYAADGYARIKGMAAIVTTFGVGELSAINGIAGSYAEYLPVVNIVGAPSTSLQKSGAIMHHTFGKGDFEVFIKMFEKVSVAVAVLDNAKNAALQIDNALEVCWIKKQPVYISLPSNMVNVEIDSPSRPLNLAYPPSDTDAIKELVARIVKLIDTAKKPVILADLCASRHIIVKNLLHELLQQTGIPFATMNMGKGIINESHPSFIGMYNGICSSNGVQARVEDSDCVISFGVMMSDFNTEGFTSKIDVNAMIEIHSDHVKVQHSVYPDVYFDAVIPALIKSLSNYRHKEKIHKDVLPSYEPIDNKITQKRFWNAIAYFLKPNDIILAETGTSMFGVLETPIPDNTTVIAQTLWCSIGYTVGAALGAALADRKRRAILFVGDGSFQLTAQEVSTMIRHKLTPVIFLLNNDGYTIERVIHGLKMIYNDVQPWQYSQLPNIFGAGSFTTKVTTEHELDEALKLTEINRDKLCFIEVMMDREDCPESLRILGKACDAKNKG